jgi:hypothetical protein
VRGFNFKIWVKSKNFKIVLYKGSAKKIAPLRPKAIKNCQKANVFKSLGAGRKEKPLRPSEKQEIS